MILAALSTKDHEVPDEGRIPDSKEGLTGVARKEIVYEEAFGHSMYDREAPLFAAEGTKENPICIFSEEPSRFVGISLPDDANIKWIELKKGELAFDPQTHNYLALRHVTPEEIEAAMEEAEQKAGNSS